MKNKKVARWGPDAPDPAQRVAEGHQEPQPWEVRALLLDRLLLDYSTMGYRLSYRSSGDVAVMERVAPGGSAGKRAGVGFLVGGVFGAAIGASTATPERMLRIRVWVDTYGAGYVRPV